MSDLAKYIEDCRSTHKILICLWALPAACVLGFAVIFGYIGANTAEHYSIDSDWQACLFTPNDAVMPLVEHAGLDPNQAPFSDLIVPMGTFVNSIIVVGCTIMLMTAMGLGVVYRAYDKPTHLVASAAFCLWCSLVSLTYYTSSPPLPIPKATNATVILLMYWLRKRLFTDLNDGDNNCGKTYNILVAYCGVCCAMVACMAVGTHMAFRAGYKKYQQDKLVAARRTHPEETPTLSIAILINTCFMCLCYVGAFLGKIITSFNSIECFTDYNVQLDQIVRGDENTIWYPDVYFPFGPATITLASELWAVTFYFVICSYMNNTVRHYRMVAFVSFLYVITSYPSIVYLMQMYYHNDLDDKEVCNNFFSQTDVAFLYGYPSDKQSETYCAGFRMTTYLGVALFGLFHIQFLLSLLAYGHYNKDMLETELRMLGAGDRKKLDGEPSAPPEHGATVPLMAEAYVM